MVEKFALRHFWGGLLIQKNDSLGERKSQRFVSLVGRLVKLNWRDLGMVLLMQDYLILLVA